MMILAISGACRGVGKTRVAMQLCEILPDSIYAKCGHGKVRRKKHENFFSTQEELMEFIDNWRCNCQYIVIESNSFCKRQICDIMIFIGAKYFKTDLRDDVNYLKSRADVQINLTSSSLYSIKEWKMVLSGKFNDLDLAHKLCNIFERQRQWLGACNVEEIL